MSSLVDYLYNSLPQVYREEDNPSLYLFRYLSSLVEGGYGEVLKDSEGLTDLLDPLKCPEELLKYFYTSFGLTYYPDIDPIYHRRILSNLGGIIQRRGTYSCIHFLARAVTNTDVSLEYYREEVTNIRRVRITVICSSLSQLQALEKDTMVLTRFLKDYLPYYIDVEIKNIVQLNAFEDVRNDVVVSSASFDYTIRHTPT